MKTITKLELQDLIGKPEKDYMPYTIGFSARPLSFIEKLHVLLKIPYNIRLNKKIETIKYFPSIESYKVILKKDLVLKEDRI